MLRQLPITEQAKLVEQTVNQPVSSCRLYYRELEEEMSNVRLPTTL